MTSRIHTHGSALNRLAHQAAALLFTGFLVALGTFQVAHAQGAPIQATSSDQVRFPAGLKWEPMREVKVLDMPKSGEVSKNPDVAVAHSLWMDEIKRSFKQAPNFSVSILLGQGRSANGTLLTFSQLNMMDFERCEPAMNGKDVVDMFTKCLARVHVNQKPQPVVKEFVGFCYLNIDNSQDNPLSKNHTEFAFEPRTNTAYFRVIQFGRDVPTCHRSVKLEGLQ